MITYSVYFNGGYRAHLWLVTPDFSMVDIVPTYDNLPHIFQRLNQVDFLFW